MTGFPSFSLLNNVPNIYISKSHLFFIHLLIDKWHIFEVISEIICKPRNLHPVKVFLSNEDKNYKILWWKKTKKIIGNRPDIKELLKKIMNIGANIRSHLEKLKIRKLRETINNLCILNRLFSELFDVFLTFEIKLKPGLMRFSM